MTLRPVHASTYFLGGGFLIILVLTLFEPTSALGMGLVERFTYFTFLVLPILAACLAVATLAFRLFSPRGLGVYVCLIGSGVVAATALAPYTLILERAFEVIDADDDGAQRDFGSEVVEEVVEVVPNSTVLWLLLNQLVIWSPPVPQRTVKPSAKSDNRVEASTRVESAHVSGCDSNPGLFKSLGLRETSQLIALEAQQHYLRVFTTDKTHFVLFGINAAVEDLDRLGVPGMLVHRSYWVNWRFVDKLDSSEGQYRCLLTNGMDVPIARRRWTEARDQFNAVQETS